MEAIIRNVRDIDTCERQALERVLGQQLRENQQIIVQVVTGSAEPEAREAPSSTQLPEWCDVYAGLSDEQLSEVEEVVLQRLDLPRPAV